VHRGALPELTSPRDRNSFSSASTTRLHHATGLDAASGGEAWFRQVDSRGHVHEPRSGPLTLEEYARSHVTVDAMSRRPGISDATNDLTFAAPKLSRGVVASLPVVSWFDLPPIP
jgi:hypothetical protein